jgi:hypothetical protein
MAGEKITAEKAWNHSKKFPRYPQIPYFQQKNFKKSSKTYRQSESGVI